MSRRFSTPLVLASASAMVAIGIGAMFIALAPGRELAERSSRAALAELAIDDRSAEAAAESFVDAWRRRSWDQAESIAIGEARARVVEKRASDAAMRPEEREVAQRAWALISSAPLVVRWRSARNVEGGRLLLSGVASYELVGAPYEREVEVLVAPHQERWRVERMELGQVITEAPAILELPEEGP